MTHIIDSCSDSSRDSVLLNIVDSFKSFLIHHCSSLSSFLFPIYIFMMYMVSHIRCFDIFGKKEIGVDFLHQYHHGPSLIKSSLRLLLLLRKYLKCKLPIRTYTPFVIIMTLFFILFCSRGFLAKYVRFLLGPFYFGSYSSKLECVVHLGAHATRPD